MNRRDYYYLELLSESELDDGFEQAEVATRALSSDQKTAGVCFGLGVSQHTPQNISVDIAAGAGYDAAGQRVAIPSLQTASLATDYLGSSTAVSGGANSKIVSVFLQFDRALSDPRIDGNTSTVYFVRDETFKFKVVQGSEAVSPTPPALIGDGILLADITRTFGQTQILTGNISTTRRQDAYAFSGSPTSIRRGNAHDAIGDLLAALNAVITGGTGVPATGIGYAGGGAWADGTTNPATTVEAELDKIIADLGVSASGVASGVYRIGGRTGYTNIGAATLGATLAAIDARASFIDVARVFTADQIFNGFMTAVDAHLGRILAAQTLSGTGSAGVNLNWDKEWFQVNCTYTGATHLLTMTFASGTIRVGARYLVEVTRTDTCTINQVSFVASGVVHRFTGSDDYLQPLTASGTAKDIYEGRVISTTEVLWEAVRF